MKLRTLMIFTFLLLMGLPLSAQPQSSQELFREANAAYEAKEYDEAIRLYNSIIDSGIENGYVFFNLGNAHYRAGDLGRAILNYERAERLIPRYPDLEVNYRLAREQMVDSEFSGFDPANVPAALGTFYHSFTFNELTVSVGMILILIAVLLEVRMLWRRAGFRTFSNYLLSFLVIMLVFLAATSAFKLRNEVAKNWAIVVASVTDVKSAPGEDQARMFSVHAGTSVEIHRSRNGWIQVSLPNGYSGWLSENDIERIGVTAEPVNTGRQVAPPL